MAKKPRKSRPRPNLDAALSAVAKEHIVSKAVQLQTGPDIVEAPEGGEGVIAVERPPVEPAEVEMPASVPVSEPEPEIADIDPPAIDEPVAQAWSPPRPAEDVAAAPPEPPFEPPFQPASFETSEIASDQIEPDAAYAAEAHPAADAGWDGRIEPQLRAPVPEPVSAETQDWSARDLSGDEAGPRLVSDNSGLLANGLGKRFKQRPVLRGVSVSVQRGEVVGLLGPNGAGKTTCFYIITGLIRPDYGSISLDGEDITDLPMYRRSRMGIGYLPQEPSIFRGLTVENNIRAVLEVVEPDRDVREARLDELLAEFSITHIRRSPALALSGGERRRVEIARALASNPHFILLDEPLAGIDPIALGDIRDLVIHLKDRGIGVLITDHNVRETLEVVDRAYIIHEGVVLMSGMPHEIVAHEDVRRVYLGEKFSL